MTLFLTPSRDEGTAAFAEAAPRSGAEAAQRAADKEAFANRRYEEIFRAAENAQIFTQNATNLLERRRAAYDSRIRDVKAATGIDLENPLRITRMPTREELSRMQPGENILETRKRLFSDQLTALQSQHPDKAGQIRADLSIEDQARAIGQLNEAHFARVSQLPDNPFGTGLESFKGSIWGYLQDPLQFATLFAGGGEGAGASVAVRIVSSVARNAAVNAGVEAALQVPAQMGRAEAGLESGFQQAAGNVALAAGLGGVAGGGMTAIGELLWRSGRAAAARAGALDADLDRTLSTALDAARDDASVLKDAPQGVTREEAQRLVRDAVEQAGGDGGPVSGAVQKPARLSDEARLLDEAAPAAHDLSLSGRPVRFHQFDPADLNTDADAYQYKGGGDASGVTDRLQGVRAWDPTASGKTFVHERADGMRYIADGHQRLGLAKRLQAEGQPVKLDGYLFREADGWTTEDVRGLAAKKNMQEGSGTPLDAARILRDAPHLLDDSLPVTGPMMRKAIGLSRLSDEAFGMTVNGLLPENQAALVGELVADPAMHGPVFKDLITFNPETEQQARLLIGESLSSGRQVEWQNDMFGSFAIERTLMGERVKVLDAAMKALKADKRLFSSLAENAEVIEAAGNQLDKAGNMTRAATAETIGALLDKLARTRGPVSDALSRAARQVADGGKPAPAARIFVRDVKAMIDEGGLRRLLNVPEPELAPIARVEPGTAEASAQADALAPETAAGLEAAGQGSMWDMLPDGVDAEGKARFTQLADLEARADREADLADLVQSCRG